MTSDKRHRRAKFRRLLSVLLFVVALAGAVASLVVLVPLTLWVLLYCAIKTPLDCLASLAVMLLLWLAAFSLVALAVLGAMRLRKPDP
ncbi:MAG: hypothetical protein DCF18_12420 [Cyanobium sp.]|uniref:hypothetical protein n=1 Tax=Synechococcus sp. CS-1333 TaxID=2848638 RepID=UPI000DBC1506|nr:hypothetical protein [Synechococcus sp. CS-1333]MCT0209952.1 hypothetical protein [Synechococcus sp. CS-1333]PZV21323.1 MAG: hypothetical protein DCF18_12420 [Cyanobium sp.]